MTETPVILKPGGIMLLMDRRWLFIGLIAVIFIGAALFIRANLPVLQEVLPGDGTTQVDASTALKLKFSEQMQPESVLQNLQFSSATSGNFEWDENTLIFTPDRAWPRGETITVTLQAGTRSTLGLPTLRDEIWSFQTSPPLLVYLWPVDGPADLYAINFQEGDVIRLTETNNGVLNYGISTDGREIYYSTRLNAENSAIFRLKRFENTTDQILFCANVLCSFPDISPDGNFLTFTRAPSNPHSVAFPQQVWLLPFADGQPEPESRAFLVSDPQNPAEAPFWSPSGSLIFYDRTKQAFEVFNPLTEERIYFPNETGEPGTWTANGDRYIVHEIEFWGDGPLDYASHLWRFDYPSATSTQLTFDLTLEDVTPSYAPDSRRIAFGRKHLDRDRWIPGSQLWLINADGSNPQPITNEPDYNHADFAWHPSGEYLAYVRHNQTNLIDPPEIWITRLDDLDAVRLVIGGYVPQWIP